MSEPSVSKKRGSDSQECKQSLCEVLIEDIFNLDDADVGDRIVSFGESASRDSVVRAQVKEVQYVTATRVKGDFIGVFVTCLDNDNKPFNITWCNRDQGDSEHLDVKFMCGKGATHTALIQTGVLQSWEVMGTEGHDLKLTFTVDLPLKK